MDEVADKEDFDNFGNQAEEDDDGEEYTTRRSKTTLLKTCHPFKRSSHKRGYSIQERPRRPLRRLSNDAGKRHTLTQFFCLLKITVEQMFYGFGVQKNLCLFFLFALPY